MSSDLTGKIAVVCGGGRGLGASTCRLLGKAGATVVAADIRDELAQEVAADVSTEGGMCSPAFVDVRDEKSVRLLIEGVVDRHGTLDVLVNSAGFDVTVPIEQLSTEEWDRINGVNLRGPFLTCREAFKVMKRRGRGHIVNIASTAAKRTWANAAGYHASKWGLVGLTHALHVEARPHRVKVTAVIAGGMRTPFLLDRFPDIDTGVLQDPDNVARTILFVLTQPEETVIPEVMVIPMRETSWP
jgi:NAD(P)-dependent dehydrogenase (short-subunit alcohol dehydrogenase family)